MTTASTQKKRISQRSLKAIGANGEKLMAWRKSRGITRVMFADMANCSERKLATYEKQTRLPESVRRQTTEAVRLLNALEEIVPREDLAEWLGTKNSGFDNRTPMELINAGESDLLWDMIYQTRESAFA
jgi:DNA-binding transcriptional regulator YiaG